MSFKEGFKGAVVELRRCPTLASKVKYTAKAARLFAEVRPSRLEGCTAKAQCHYLCG